VRVVCQSPAIPIPDANQAGIDSTLTIDTDGPLTDLNVSLQVAHTFVGDLVFRLTHVESGTSVTLFDRPVGGGGTCNGVDIAALLDDEAALPVDQACGDGVPAINGTFTPGDPLAAFDGENLNGSWTLTASDNAGQNVGVLNSWCLQPAIDVAPDSDGDGLADDEDNCTVLANADQHDTDGDGIGNLCDGDFDQTCAVNFGDLGIMKQGFFAMGDLVTDMNADGATNFTDLGLLKGAFFAPPGPSGVPNVCSP
jgi:subtilisin-like proprotein convertase family protein